MAKQPGSPLGAIGSTPLVSLRKLVPQGSAEVVVKLESLNPTGSYKDRMALSMIEQAEARGDLRPGMTVLEYTGGSTGTSLAFVCAVRGYPFTVVSSDAYSQEKLRMMAAYGADVRLVASKGGRTTPDLVPRMVELANSLAAEEGVYFTDQLRNGDTLLGYRRIGEELLEQVEAPIDVFCGSVGTAGMLMGVADALNEANPSTSIVALEPAESPILTEGRSGAHGVEGIGLGFIPPHLDKARYDRAVAIQEAEARQMAQRLAKEEGLFVGTSSGLNVAAALQLAREVGPGGLVATVAVDTGMKYLTGGLFEYDADAALVAGA